ncbi:MAG: sodium/solute symporter [Candidatus Marinimicrobia bacterium]|nr:sodium/solute symporter [Candidatus Neomarinimicrobiota bacterium]
MNKRTPGPWVWLVLSALWTAVSWGDFDPDRVLDWSQLPMLPDPVGVAGPFAGVTGDRLIVAGGANFPGRRPWDGGEKVWHDRIYLLAEPAGEWQVLEQALPRPTAYGVSVTWEDAVICLGGGDAQSHFADVYALRWHADALVREALPPLPGPAAYLAGAVLGQHLYVAGGLAAPDATQTLRTFWRLNLADAAAGWEALDPWPGPGRYIHVVGVQDGAFYLFGGCDLVRDDTGTVRREFLTDAYRYRPAEGWMRIADLPAPVSGAPTPAPALGGAHLLVLGGHDGEPPPTELERLKDHWPPFTDRILAYHTITDTWTALGRLPRNLGPDPAGNPNAGTWPAITTVTTWWRGRIVVPNGEIRPGVRTPRVPWAEPRMVPSGFQPLDFVVVGVYLGALVAMGFYFSRRERTTDDFFLGGRRIPWWAAGLSIYGTQLSAITFMAVPALVYRTNWVYLPGNLMIAAIAPVIVYVYLPFYRRLNVTTAYEYLEQRFHVTVRLLGSLAFLLFQLGRMAVVLFLPSLALATVTGLNIYLCISVMGVLATLYTVLGGIEAVIWTDVLQVLVLMGGALLGLLVIITKVPGGLGGIIALGTTADKFRVANLTWDMAAASLWVVVLGQWLAQLVPYSADQTVVQRYLTTKDEQRAARSIWTNAVITLPGGLVFFALGTGLWAFYKTHPELLNPVASPDDILPWFVAQQLPVGISGLVIAGLFAAAMSSLDSSMNSMATAITTDGYRRFNANATDAGALRLARWLTLLLGLFGTGAAIALAKIGSLGMWDTYIQLVGLTGAGLAGLFALGIFSRRANSSGALAGFCASALVLYAVKRFTNVHFFLYAGIGVFACLIVGWLVSAATGGMRGRSLEGLTIYTIRGRREPAPREARRTRSGE